MVLIFDCGEKMKELNFGNIHIIEYNPLEQWIDVHQKSAYNGGLC